MYKVMVKYTKLDYWKIVKILNTRLDGEQFVKQFFENVDINLVEDIEVRML